MEVEAPEWSLDLATAVQDHGIRFDPQEARVTVFPTTVEVLVVETDERQAREPIRSAFGACGMRWSDTMVKRIAEEVPER